MKIKHFDAVNSVMENFSSDHAQFCVIHHFSWIYYSVKKQETLGMPLHEEMGLMRDVAKTRCSSDQMK